nr:iron chelate uptake ABC transporter family permease subunit [Blautia caecimuris]
MKKQDISPSAITAGYLKRQRRYILTTGILLLLTLSLAAVMMLYGNTIYSPETVLRVLSGTDAGGAAFTIRTLRFPRMLTAILCGMAFGLSGNTFQQLLGNPLASPDIIGVTSGASVAAVFGILILKLDYGIVAVMAVFSGLLVSALIYFLSHKK